MKVLSKKDNLQRHYSIEDVIKMTWWIIRSKLLDFRIRLIRRPVVIRGSRYIDFGKALTTGHWCRFEAYPTSDDKSIKLKFGDNIQVNDFVHISALEKVEIGDGCLIASHVYISDNSHGSYKGTDIDSSPEIEPGCRAYSTAPVIIGKNCWIGESVIVMPGVSIGDGCIIGAHAVVNKNIPSASIAVGSPAKVIKKYNFKTGHWEHV